MKTYLTPLAVATLLFLFGSTAAPAQESDLPGDILETFDEQNEPDLRLAQRPDPPREPRDVIKPREPRDRDPDERRRDRGDRKDPPREGRPDGPRPGPEQLQARLAAVERKLDRILMELRRIEARDRDRGPRPPRPDRDVLRPRDGGPLREGGPPRDRVRPAPPGPRPQTDRLRDRPEDGSPPRDRIRPRPERFRPDIERFPGRSPEGLSRDRGPRPDRGFGPPDRDRFDNRDRRPDRD
jgi:hypothetical protein